MGKLNVFLKIILSICLSCSYSSFADDCTRPVTPIRTGERAVCDGYLFSPDAESEAYKAKQLADLYKKENEILEKRLELYVRQSDVLAKQVARTENTESLYRLGYFALGVIITGVIASNVNR